MMDARPYPPVVDTRGIGDLFLELLPHEPASELDAAGAEAIRPEVVARHARVLYPESVAAFTKSDDGVWTVTLAVQAIRRVCPRVSSA
jgi:hypothetical protein